VLKIPPLALYNLLEEKCIVFPGLASRAEPWKRLAFVFRARIQVRRRMELKRGGRGRTIASPAWLYDFGCTNEEIAIEESDTVVVYFLRTHGFGCGAINLGPLHL
jgi:hypothetical protein